MIRKRFYVSGYSGCDWDVSPEYAPSPEEALSQAQHRYRGTKFNPEEVDPKWDAAMIDGETILRWNLTEEQLRLALRLVQEKGPDLSTGA